MAYKNNFPKMYIFTKCLQIKCKKKKKKTEKCKTESTRQTIPTSETEDKMYNENKNKNKNILHIPNLLSMHVS